MQRNLKPILFLVALIICFGGLFAFKQIKSNETAKQQQELNYKNVNDSSKSGQLKENTNVKATENKEIKKEEKVLLPNRLVVYYFHSKQRCKTCMNFEKYTKELIAANFPEQEKKGLLEFQSISISDEDGKKYVQQYQLVSKSIILSTVKDNKETEFKNLDKIWDLIGEEAVFKQYVKENIDSILSKM